MYDTRRQLLAAVAVLAAVATHLGTGVPALAQADDEQKYRVSLESRSFLPQRGISPSLRQRLARDLEQGATRHVLVQLERHLDEDEREELARQGVRLLDYVGSYTWYAAVSDPRVTRFTSPTERSRSPILGQMRWLGEIRADDKIEATIRKQGVSEYNRVADDTVEVVVIFFADVEAEAISSLIQDYGEAVREPGLLNDVVVRLLESAIRKLAAEDAVRWIEEVGAADEVHNDGSRATINVEPLQVAPYDLDGTNVQVGEWDGGEIDDTHDDLAGRVTIVEVHPVSDHATHVAGTLGGTGILSAGAGGTPNQWRGMATAVDFFSYSFLADDLEPEEHNGAINTHGIDLSQNSWGRTGNFGDYRARTAKYDNIVRGFYGARIPIIFSAGNSGPGFTTVTPPGGTAKNTIVVGNVLSDTKALSNSSSRGPTDNGVLKPDVVAPGNESPDPVLQVPDIKSAVPTDTYGEMSGTSMASPAVSGTIALMLQQYRQTIAGSEAADDTPLPSTYKAILAHTAEDLTANPGGGLALVGPDYFHGYGLINAKKAVDMVQTRSFLEDVILDPGDEDLHTLAVVPGTDELKVTLAWDDVAGTAGAADILQNDLDLVVINPTGTAFYPPWELDPATPGAPAARNSYASEALAGANRDNLNVMEQVLIDNPDPGNWTVKIKAADLPFAPQEYSLVMVEIAAEIQVPGPLAFGDVCVGSSGMAVLDVCNTGKADLIVDAIASSDPQFAVTTPSSGYPVTISPAFCFPFQAVFTPGARGAQAATLTITSNDPDTPNLDVAASGNGTEEDITVTGTTDFGVASAWSHAERTVSVCNTGNCDLSVTGATVNCPDFTLVGNPFPATLAPGVCLDLTVRFTPTKQGPVTCELAISSDDPDTPVVTRTLTARTPPFFSLHTGLVEPHGVLGTAVDQGSIINLDFVYPFTPRLAWDVRLGRASFDGLLGAPDVDVWKLGANIKWLANPPAAVRFFLNGGLGVYHFDPGDFEGGANGGLGLNMPVGRRFQFEATYNYHFVFTAAPDLKFSEGQLGFLVSF